jgi:hypothetical protein
VGRRAVTLARRYHRRARLQSSRVDGILGQVGEQLVGVLLLDQRLLEQTLRFREPQLLGPCEQGAVRMAFSAKLVSLSWWTKRAFRSFSAMVQSPGHVGARTRVTAETSGRSSRLPLSGAAHGRLERVLGRRPNACSCAYDGGGPQGHAVVMSRVSPLQGSKLPL